MKIIDKSLNHSQTSKQSSDLYDKIIQNSTLSNTMNFWKNYKGKEDSAIFIKSKINDAYQNILGNFGFDKGVAEQGAKFVDSKAISWNFNRLNQIYRTQPLVSKISTTWSNEMVKSGIDLRADIPTEEVSKVEEELKIQNISISNALNWSFIFGLSACIIYLDGEFNQQSLQTPLDMDLITKGSFLGLKTVIRWQGIMPIGSEYVEKIGKDTGAISPEELGEPLYYEVWFLNSNVKYKVHRSRLIIFNGLKLPGIENIIEQGAGVSLIERIWLPLLNYLATINFVQNMLMISQQRVLYLADANRIGLQSQEGQAEFNRTMHSIAKNTDMYNMLVLDQDDEFEYVGANFSNLDKIIQAAQEDLSAAANMPLNKLFGKSPTGLNNSSKENLVDFYDFISRLRNNDLRLAYTKLIPIIYKSIYGKDIGQFSFDFKSLFMPDEQEKALIIDRKTRPLEKAWENNAITLLQYLTELKDIGKTSDCFTNITDEQINEIKSNGLAECRHCDFESGYIVNNKFVASIKELKSKFTASKNKNIKNINNSLDNSK